MRIDTLLHPQWVITVDAEDRVLADHSVAIRDGQILDILPKATSEQKYSAAHTLELPGHALIPGLINTHTHATMCLLRGIADDLPLMKWLHQHIWPAEQRWVGEEEGRQILIIEVGLIRVTIERPQFGRIFRRWFLASSGLIAA